MQNINVNIVPDSYPQTIRYSQGDVGREFKINVVGFTIPTGATVKIQATKPSGFGFSVAGTVDGNAVSFTTTAIMTDEAGRFPAELEITKDSVVIGTANFIMWGEANPHPEGTTDGQQGTIIPELTLLVERVEAAASSVLDMEVVATTLPAGSQATYSYDEDLNKATFGIPQGEAGAGAAGVVADAYSSSKTYKVGDYVLHNSNLYRCTTAITTAEAFTAAHWTQIVLANDVSDLKTDLGEIYDDITGFSKIRNIVPCTSGTGILRQNSWRTINIPNGDKYRILVSSNAVQTSATVAYYLSTDGGITYDDSVTVVNGTVSDLKTSSKNYNAIALYIESAKVIANGHIDVIVYVGDESQGIPNQITKIEEEITVNDEKVDINSKWLYDIYGSTTDNLLDVSTFIDGYYVARSTPYIAKGVGARMSRFIPVENLQGESITISGNSLPMEVLFLSEAKLDNTANIEEYNLNSDSRTVTVPSNAKYALVSFRTLRTDESLTHDYSSMKFSIGSSATSANFNPKYIGNPLIEKNLGFNGLLEYQRSKALDEYTPLTVGAPNGLTYSRQYNRSNFVFFTDSHIDLPNGASEPSLENVINTIDFVNKCPFDIDGVINAGDVYTHGGLITQADFIEAMSPFFDELKKSKAPVIFSIGNHDTNDWSNIPANAMNETGWGEAWLNFAESNMGIVRQTKANGKKSTWHYKDIADKKIRIISVDVQDTDKSVTNNDGKVLYNGGVAWYISDEQMNWIANTALNFDNKAEKDWGVIIVLHQTCSNNNSWYATSLSPAYESAIYKLLEMCQAFNTQTDYSETYTFATDSFYDLSVSAEFSKYANEDKPPYIICILNGHEHYDRYTTINGINIIWALNGGCDSEYGDSRIVRIPNTPTQNSFTLLSIDTTERKIRFVRYGAGKNCFGDEPYDFMPNGLSF